MQQQENEKKFSGAGAETGELDEDNSSIALSQINEPTYRFWLGVRTRDGKPPLYVSEAVYGGAEAVGCSPQACREYLKKLVSPVGGYDSVPVTVGKKRTRQIQPKKDVKIVKSVGDLSSKHGVDLALAKRNEAERKDAIEKSREVENRASELLQVREFKESLRK